MDKEYLQSLYTPEQQLLIFGDANYFNNQDNNKLPFTSMVDMAAKNANVDLFPSPQDLYTGAIANNPTYLAKQRLGFPTGITSSSAASTFGTDTDRFQGFTKNTPSDQGTNFQFLPSANEDETDVVEEKKRGGIADLFRAILGFAVPGFNFLIGGPSSALKGIKSLNQKFRGGLDDFFDRRRYGGKTRDEAFAEMITQSRGIQKKIDAGDYGTRNISIDRGRGSIPSRTTSAPKRSFSQNPMAADRSRSRNEARTSSRVSGGKTRAYGL